MPNTFALRYTPPDPETATTDSGGNILDAFAPLIARAEKIVIGEEGNEKVNKHFHAHITTTLSDDTLRKLIQTSLKIPKVGRGKGNTYYSLKEWDTDIAYIVKSGNVIEYKGYTEEEIAQAIATGQDRYAGKVDEIEFHKSHHSSLWDELKVEALKKGFKTYKEFYQFINYYSLKKGGPLQHPANVKRYAQSLMILQKAHGDDNLLMFHSKADLDIQN